MSGITAALGLICLGFVVGVFLRVFPRTASPSIVRLTLLLPLAGLGVMARSSSADDVIVAAVLAMVVVFVAMTPEPADH